MSQVTDRTVGANPTGFDMRTELNNIIAALESDNSGSSEPLNPVPYMKWLDTSDSTYYYYKERNHDNTAWVTLFRYTVATKVMEVVSNGAVLSQTNIASDIHASSSKTTPVDADEIGLIDSASTFTLKKLTWSNLKDTLKTYFGTLYVALSGNQTIAGIKTFSSSPIVPTPINGTQAVNKDYADSKVSKPELVAITGTAIFNRTTQNINLMNIGNITLAIGDVIEVTGTISNNKLFTVESIVDNNNIVVNYEHRGTSTPAPSKRLINETASNCIIKLYNRAKNAPLGQGQDWAITQANRVNNAINQNLTNRTIVVSNVADVGRVGVLYSSDGINFIPCVNLGAIGNTAAYVPMSFEVPPFCYFKYDSLSYQYSNCRELR